MKAYKTGEVATICGVASRTVASWIDSGRLKGHRIPGSSHRRVLHDDLANFMRDHGMPEAMIPKLDGESTATAT